MIHVSQIADGCNLHVQCPSLATQYPVFQPSTTNPTMTTTQRVVWGHAPPKLLTFTLIPIAITLIAHPLIPLLPSSIRDPLQTSFPPLPTFPALQANIGFSILAFVGSIWAVPFVSQAFADKGLKGRDLCKPGGKTSGPWV